MLPSTGLFKTIICPKFEAEGCNRPYCHFKHVRKDEEIVPEKPPTYIPLRRLEPIALPVVEPRKKPKLEYVPTRPEINDGPRQFNCEKSVIEAPAYIPSSCEIREAFSPTNDIDIDDCTEEIDTLASIVDAANDNEKSETETAKVKDPQITLKRSNGQHSSESSSSKHKKSHRSSREDDRRHRKKTTDEKSNKDVSSHRSKRHHSSSSSSKNKDKSSQRDCKDSNSKSKKERDKERHTDKDSKRRSSSKKIKTERETSKSPKKQADPDDYDNDNLFDMKNSDFGSSSDEDEIMAQCKMIFEGYKPSSAIQKTIAVSVKSDLEKIADKTANDIELQTKKRVAYENANAAKGLTAPPQKKENHVHNAMQSIYLRQEALRLQQHEEFKKKLEEEKKQQDEQIKKPAAAPAPTSQSKLDALIRRFSQEGNHNRNGATAKKPIIRSMTMASIEAIAKAKQKVAEMKAAKQITPCQTVQKTGKREAHKSAAVQDTKPAPPILEKNSTKISFNIRMQYYNIMVKHCLDIYPNCEDAWERAQTEELSVFKKCNTSVIYKSSALLSINKLRKESIEAGNISTQKNKTISHEVILAGKLAQNTSWSVNKKLKTDLSGNSLDPFKKISSSKVYELVLECILTEEQLKDNGYPRKGSGPGTAVVTPTYKNLRPPNEDERYCCRCSKLFNFTTYEEEASDSCNYHPKGAGYRRGFVDHAHRCCQQPAGTPGCTYANYHVTDFVNYDNLTGFVTTMDADDSYVPTKKDIFALDCEMCYTTHGLELTRVTVVDFDCKIVYDGLVKPDNRIIDYNTNFSGITAEMLEKETKNLRGVQAILLSMFSSKTILVGHSLESDLKALKLIHSVVVDTSVLFPHKMGPPKKRALKTLCIENLKRIIQESEGGHDSAEDAEVCIQLVKFYLRNRIV